MDKKIVALLLLLAFTLATATWTYKGQGFADNQVVVYITGSQLTTPGGVERFETGPIPTLKPGETVAVPVDGITTPCKLSTFTQHSTATGTYLNGHLTNGVQLQESDYIELADYTRDHSTNWGTNEAVNSLEVAGCAVLWQTKTKMQVNDLSSQNGGLLDPHKSHQRGLDADVPLLCTDGTNHYSCGHESKFDPETSWIMIKALATTTPVQYIFLRQSMINQLHNYANSHETNYQLRQAIFASLLHPDPTHYTHFHIRFHCSSEDTAAGCIDQAGGFRGTNTLEPTINDENQEETTPPEVSTTDTGNAGGSGNSLSDDQLLAKAASDPNKCLLFEPDLNPIISQCSQKYGIDENLIRAVIIAESGGHCSNKGGRPIDISNRDAHGLMQVKQTSMEDVNRLRRIGVVTEPDLVWPGDMDKPSKNICAGTQELASYWDTRVYKKTVPGKAAITTIDHVLQAYNAGIDNFQNGIIGQGTLDYVEKVKRYYRELTGTDITDPTAPGGTIDGLA